MEAVTNECVVCGLDLNLFPSEAVRGMGDGRGNRFAHDSCYWRAQVERLEKLTNSAIDWEAIADALARRLRKWDTWVSERRMIPSPGDRRALAAYNDAKKS